MCLHHTEGVRIIVLRYTTILKNLYMESVISTFMEYFGDSGFIRIVHTDPPNCMKSRLRKIRA